MSERYQTELNVKRSFLKCISVTISTVSVTLISDQPNVYLYCYDVNVKMM